MLQAVYQAQLLEHYRNPRNKGLVSNPSFATDEFNPSCGDRVTLSGIIVADRLQKIGFEGAGCVVSQATASLLSEYALGKSVTELLAITPSDIQKLIGIELGFVRLKCALLPLEALQKGIQHYTLTRAQD